MAGTTAVERAIDNIRYRDWAIIRERWLAYIPDINPAGAAPVLPLISVPGLADFAEEAAAKRSIRISGDQMALRTSLFWEGTYLLHKACHIVGGGGLHANEGLSTWSLSSFYQGAMFAAKSILYLMGVGLPEFKSKTLLVDIWPEPSAEQRRLQKKGFNPPPEAQLTHLPSRLDHHAAWYALLRVVRTCRVDVWPNDCVGAIRTLAVGEISDQRNALHYRHATWLFNDLHVPQSIVEFFHLERDDDDSLFVDPDRDDFTLVLAVIVLKMGLLLFDSLQKLSKNLTAESALFTAAIEQRNHIIYARATNASAAWASE
jgi:hypothetical protein